MRKKPDDTMLSQEYRQALEKLSLSIVGAAPFLGVAWRQSQRYASGDSPVPATVAKLLRIFLKHPELMVS